MCFLIKLRPLPCLQPLNACMCHTWRACSLKIGSRPASGLSAQRWWSSGSRTGTQGLGSGLRDQNAGSGFRLGLRARALCFGWGSEPWLRLALSKLPFPKPVSSSPLAGSLSWHSAAALSPCSQLRGFESSKTLRCEPKLPSQLSLTQPSWPNSCVPRA